LDRAGEPVGVTGRGQFTAAPAQLGRLGRNGAHPRAEIAGWAGPWPADEKWWDPEEHRRRARLQVVLGDGSAHLLVLEEGGWCIEATYD
ncbi:MAG TPA: hypothetical protein VGP46_08500, partial [Acidimicrobiales bacterium]|nr:hypothetical protein [Acidimicrobiales bacterium]